MYFWLQSADSVFGDTLYGDDEECADVWFNYPPHPLQEQEPLGDRKWIPQFPLLVVNFVLKTEPN